MKRIAAALIVATAIAAIAHADKIRLPNSANNVSGVAVKPAGSATDAMKADPGPEAQNRKWLDERQQQINALQKKAEELKDREFVDNFGKFIGVDGGNGDIIARKNPDIDVNAATAGPFGASWVTETSTGQRYAMTLVQTGANVVGAYEPLEGAGTPGLLAGTVGGRTLTYRWREGATTGGLGKFTLSSDGTSFKGWWNNSNGDANRVDGRWKGERKDAAGRVALPIQTKNDATTSAAKAGEFEDERQQQLDFDIQRHGADANDAAARGAPQPDWRTFGAEWATVTSANVAYAMKLTQTGATVRGTYARDGRTVGSLDGTVEGDTLVYRWREGMSTGTGKFKLSADGASFTGWWNNDDANPDAVAGNWNGTRK
jgi:hypothetical protein